jgi:hypothetical protein
VTVTDARVSQGPARPVSGRPVRPSPAEEALRRFEAWFSRHGLGAGDDERDLDLLEWQLAMLKEYERLLLNERAVTLSLMSASAGSIRKLAERIGRPFSTLRAQMKLKDTTEE